MPRFLSLSETIRNYLHASLARHSTDIREGWSWKFKYNTKKWQAGSWTGLKNFKSDEWANRYNHYSRIGYDDELELYDLLEMDAGGEVDDLDDFTQDIVSASCRIILGCPGHSDSERQL
jgi:hypothetical protein